jgi:uncharacterized membrane protein YheB (UPF0754 family)
MKKKDLKDIIQKLVTESYKYNEEDEEEDVEVQETKEQKVTRIYDAVMNDLRSNKANEDFIHMLLDGNKEEILMFVQLLRNY